MICAVVRRLLALSLYRTERRTCLAGYCDCRGGIWDRLSQAILHSEIFTSRTVVYAVRLCARGGLCYSVAYCNDKPQ